MQNNQYRYEVALSFAGEQRAYVEQVANSLREMGVICFYDNHNQVELWGKNLIKYLENIYFRDSKYCVIFISKEYYSKHWTIHESEAAEERNFYSRDFDSFQQYILPVRFDNTKIPGIRESWGYIDANIFQPKSLAEFIYQKVRGQEYTSISTPETLEDILDYIIQRLTIHANSIQSDSCQCEIEHMHQNTIFQYSFRNKIIFYFRIHPNNLLGPTEAIHIYDSVFEPKSKSEVCSAKITKGHKPGQPLQLLNLGFSDDLDLKVKISKENIVDLIISKIEKMYDI